MKVRSKFLDFALYFVFFALFVYGMERVYTLKGKFLIVLVLVVGSIYEYFQLIKQIYSPDILYMVNLDI